MTDFDDAFDRDLRALATAARASVAVLPAEIDQALAEVTSGAEVARLRPIDEPHRGWARWLAVAAAVALVSGAGMYFLVGRDERVSTVDPTVPVTVPPTRPGQTVTTTDAAPPSPFADLEWQPTGIERTCDDEGYNCTRLLADPDDVVYACDPATRTLTRYGDVATITTPGLGACPFEIGPAEVAYLWESADDGSDDLVAVSVADGTAGTELHRWPGWNLADGGFVPTPAGLAIAWSLAVGPQPDLTRSVDVEWVLPDPATPIPDIPVAQFDPGDASRAPALARRDLRWELDFPVFQTTVPVPTDDGGVIAAMYHVDDVDNRLVRGWPDGTFESIPLASVTDVDLLPALLERTGTIIVPDGDTFARINPFPEHPQATAPPGTTTLPTEPPPLADAGPVLDGLYYEYSGIDRSCTADGLCTQVVYDPSGAPVSLDRATGTVTRHLRDSGGPAQFTLPEFDDRTYLVAAGPDEVVYVAHPTESPENYDVIAYALAAGDAGREVARFPGVLGVGDSDRVPSPDGLVSVGWYGQGLQPPEPFDVVIEWVDRNGQPTTSWQPIVRSDFYGIAVAIGDRQWTFADPVGGAHPSMPPIVPTFDGGFVAVYHHGADGSTAVVRGWSDGTVDTWTPPADAGAWLELVPDPSGYVLVPNDDWFARAELFPARSEDYWDGERQTDVVAGTVVAVGLNEFLDTNDPWWEDDPIGLANAIAGDLDSPAERRSIEIVRAADLGAEVRVTTEGYLDDSVRGTQLVVHLTATDGSYRVDRIDWANTCQQNRGHQDYRAEYCT